VYTIIGSEIIKFDDNGAINRVDIVADSENDIPKPEANWSPGSTVFITETHTMKMLNNKGAWE
jgi:hypothetical protein